MTPHPATVCRLRELRNQELLAEAALHRLAASARQKHDSIKTPDAIRARHVARIRSSIRMAVSGFATVSFALRRNQPADV